MNLHAHEYLIILVNLSYANNKKIYSCCIGITLTYFVTRK